MISIFIKSFNRPYYLHRCLKSIEQMVSGNYSIQVLDDGTPRVYLDKIQQLFPNILIKTSKQYDNKCRAIEENSSSGKEIDGFSIPTDLWIQAVKESGDYFLMIEDDVWFTQPFDIDFHLNICTQKNIALLKLGWLGNFQDEAFLNISKIEQGVYRCIPKKILLFPGKLNDWFFFNRYKFFSLLFKIGFVNNTTKQKYWSLNSILMGFWQKDYWLYIWKDAYGKVDEKRQLCNAAAYYKKQQANLNFIARTEKEILRTTFQSSATNAYHYYGLDIDINKINRVLNQYWLENSLHVMENIPHDFSLNYIKDILLIKKVTPYHIQQWVLWVNHFKNQYRRIGATVD